MCCSVWMGAGGGSSRHGQLQAWRGSYSDSLHCLVQAAKGPALAQWWAAAVRVLGMCGACEGAVRPCM